MIKAMPWRFRFGIQRGPLGVEQNALSMELREPPMNLK
jgi:hypothetical protein